MNYNKTEEIPSKVPATVCVCTASYNIFLSITISINKKNILPNVIQFIKLILQQQASHK
jgi:hypothetical protein